MATIKAAGWGTAARIVGLYITGLAGGCATTADNGQGSGAAALASPRTRPAARDDGLAMRAERGAIDQDEAEAAIAGHFSQLKRCYAEAGAATGFAGGNVTLHFDVAVDGRTTSVNVQSSRLGNLAVEQCLMTTARAITFPRPHGNARASFEYSLEFRSTGERPVIDLPDDSVQAIRTSLLVRLGGDCESLGVSPLQTTVYVDRRGQVQSAGLAAERPIPNESATCASTSMRRAPLAVATELTGNALGRVTLELSNADLLQARAAHAAAAKPARRPDRVAGKGRDPRTDNRGRQDRQGRQDRVRRPAPRPTAAPVDAGSNDRLAAQTRR